MDQLVYETLGGGKPSRTAVFDRSRHAIARFTMLMVLFSAGFAVIGGGYGTRFVEERTVLALSDEVPSSPTLSAAQVSQRQGSHSEGSHSESSRRQGLQRQGSTSQPTSPVAPDTISPDAFVPRTVAPGTTNPPTISSETTAPLITAEGEIVAEALAPVTTAGEATTTLAPVDSSPSGRGQRALADISYPWQDKLSGWTVVFKDGQSGLYGLTLVDEKRIEIYVRDGQDQSLLVHIVAHEIGHAVDVTLNDGGDRRRWQEIRGIGDEPWWPDAAASDFRTGAGDFAEGFAYWQVRNGNYRSKLGPAPSESQLQLMAEISYG